MPACFIVSLSYGFSFAQETHDELTELLELVENPPKLKKKPHANIEMDGDLLRCSGDSPLAQYNNKGLELINNRQFHEAVKWYENGLSREALFLPFRYNIGICYIHLFDLKRALLHFNKARMIVPEYSKIYLNIGYIYERMNKYDIAIDYYRMALHRNSNELDTFVLIGNIHYLKNEFKMAVRYYDAALTIDKTFPNALLGKAKILLSKKKYIQSMVYLKSVDTKRDYDKSYHYYYAECSFKLREYKSAAYHYGKLLDYKADRFFLTNSPALIEHKLELSQKLIIGD